MGSSAQGTMHELRRAILRLERDPSDLLGFVGDVRGALEEHEDGSESGEARIPDLLLMELRRYAEHRPVRLAHSTRLLLEGSLLAVTAVDARTFASIRTVIRWMHNCMHAESWGSPEKVKRWLATASEEAS